MKKIFFSLFKNVNKTKSIEEQYNDFLNKAMFAHHSKKIFLKYYNKIPRQRAETFRYCINFLEKKDKINIVELGTTRSFVDGKFRGCKDNNIKWWKPNNPKKWDWSAGIFTKYMSDVLKEREINYKLTSIDLNENALEISKIMTEESKHFINYIKIDSETFIKQCDTKSVDLLYIDTGSMDEPTAKLQLREAKLIVSKNILKDDGLILIDDVKNPAMIINNVSSDVFGKSKYSIPYLIDNGYEYVMDEYQVILRKST